MYSLDLNATEISIPLISASPSVTRILREIFQTYEPYCARHTYNRGVGRPLHACPDHAPEQDGLLCYPPCRDGYNGVGPVCWEKCENITSFGFVCVDISLAKHHSCPWYDKCGLARSSCRSCPMNYTKIGCLCGRLHLRSSYGRGVGYSLTCSNSYERGGPLCYPKCDKGYHGIGPVCRQTCPSTQPYSCFTGCSKTKELCKDKFKAIIQSIIVSSITILNVIIGIPLVSLKTLDILADAAKGHWVPVAKNILTLAEQLTYGILPFFRKKYPDQPVDAIESATKNASFIITVTAFKDQYILYPLFKYFHFDSIYSAFNHGQCELEFA